MTRDNSLYHFASREERARDDKQIAHFWWHDDFVDGCEWCREREAEQIKEASEDG